MMNCQQVSHLVSESLDRRLSLAQRLRVRLHLMMCRGCTRYEQQVRFIREAARRWLEGA